MKCFRCIVEAGTQGPYGPKFGPRESITTYKGTELCVRHAIEEQLLERREDVRPQLPKSQRKAVQA